MKKCLYIFGLHWWCRGQSICLQCGRLRYRFDPWVGKIPWRRKWQPTPVLLPGKFHGRRSLVGYSPWGHKESDTTERLHFTSYIYSREGNGNRLQHSCLENSMDRGTWWATVHGVTESWTRLSDWITNNTGQIVWIWSQDSWLLLHISFVAL